MPRRESLAGAPFYKMTGSGNDFVFFDARAEGTTGLEDTARIRAVCARGTGIGADGVVFLAPSAGADVAIRYYNADGSRAALCGNATLCTVRLAPLVGVGAVGADLRIETDAGVLTGRLRAGDEPEFDLGSVEGVAGESTIARLQGEEAIGFAIAGIPHLVVRVSNVEIIDVAGRGQSLRNHPAVGPQGANVNFVGAVGPASAIPAGAIREWRIRTYERGVEGETLACGTGAVATAAVLARWGLVNAQNPIPLRTRSGELLTVRLHGARNGSWSASLAGEGRLVFGGVLAG